MSNTSNTNGRAFEYACIITLRNLISEFRVVEVIVNNSLQVCKREWEKLSDSEQNIFLIGASAAANQILILEPRIEESFDDDDILTLSMQNDLSGVAGDVRDLLIIRSSIKWEIGLSLKHNNFAVKHSRIGAKLDFGESWFNIKCSEEYWADIHPIFEYLSQQKRLGLNFKQLPNKEDDVYVPLLKAFKKELIKIFSSNKKNPGRLVEYLLGRYDFYKIISMDSQKYSQIQAMNIHKTLNLDSTSKQSKYKIPKVKLPTRVIHLDFKPDSKTTLELYMDGGWQFTFRIHNAKTEVEESLKFDIQMIGMPTAVITINCRWV